jgi:hypothetical protein
MRLILVVIANMRRSALLFQVMSVSAGAATLPSADTTTAVNRPEAGGSNNPNPASRNGGHHPGAPTPTTPTVYPV